MTRIAACLITRNSERTIEMALQSVRAHVDAVFVYDTGSEDGTIALLETLNETQAVLVPAPTDEDPDATREVRLAPITVQRGDWRDDFAWAREQSFRMAGDSFDWFLWLDDDDVVEGAENLRALAAGATPQTPGFVFFYDYARDENGNNVCQLWRERLIRRDAGFTWRNRVHEVLVTEHARGALTLVPANVVRYVHHRPPDKFPTDRNLRLLTLQADDEERELGAVTPRTLAYLGTETMSVVEDGWQQAAEWFVKYLDHPGAVWVQERLQVRHKLAMCLRAAGRLDAAVSAELEALRESDAWAETFCGLAETYAAKGDWGAVERWARRALELGLPQTMLILNPLELTFLPMVRIGQACMMTGRYPEGHEWLERARAIAPSNPILRELVPAFERERFQGELAAHVLAVCEALVGHDENEKALRLLEECVPYAVRHRPEVIRARVLQREACRHMTDPAVYEAVYEPATVEATVDDDLVPRAPELLHRVRILETGLEEQEQQLGRKPSVVDLGCNDFWAGAYLWTRGYRVDGVELSEQRAERARGRAERFSDFAERTAVVAHADLHRAGAALADEHARRNGGDGNEPRYDAVVLFEVLEHVPDPDQALKACERLLNPGGRVYVSTPNGVYDPHADWAAMTPKQHMRAWPVHELLERLSRRGEIAIADMDQGIAVCGYTPGRRRGKVVFFGGPAPETWVPNQIRAVGLGGSETALVQVASRLAMRGFEVKVYAEVPEPSLMAGVLFLPLSWFDPTEEADAIIVSRTPPVFDEPLRAPVRALWCHDMAYVTMTPERAERMTHVAVLSDWQAREWKRVYPYLDAGKLTVLRNGVGELAGDEIGEIPATVPGFYDRDPVVVYSSAPDRGLRLLLELWPRIRELVPEARLEVLYGWETFDVYARQMPELADFKAELLAKVAELGGEDAGIVFRGRVGQDELAATFQRARVLGYPAVFRETSCITAMEARANGLPVVTSRLAALAETVGSHGIMLDLDGDPDEIGPNVDWRPLAASGYGDRFVSEVARLLTDPVAWARWSSQGRRGARRLAWEAQMAGWERLVLQGRRGRHKPRERRREPVAA